MRRVAEVAVVLALLLGALAWMLLARPGPPVEPLPCGAVAGLAEDGRERIACLDDPALRGCDARAGERYERASDGSCRPAGPLRGAVLRLHGLPIDANRATVEDLRAIEGLGPGLAAKVVEAREQGPFCKPEDLLRVSGIGPARLKELAPALRFGDPRCGGDGR